MSNKMPEKLISHRVYLNGKDLLGVAEVQLPDLEAITDTIKGAGIAGEIESPTPGFYGPLNVTINWRTIDGNVMTLARPMAHHLEFRGAVQVYDAGLGTYSVKPQKVLVKAMPKKVGLGKHASGASQETSNEFECSYIMISVDGKIRFELDKFNFKCVVDGVDVLYEVREALGMN